METAGSVAAALHRDPAHIQMEEVAAVRLPGRTERRRHPDPARYGILHAHLIASGLRPIYQRLPGRHLLLSGDLSSHLDGHDGADEPRHRLRGRERTREEGHRDGRREPDVDGKRQQSGVPPGRVRGH